MYDEFIDFSNSTIELNWKVNNLLSEIENVSGRLKVSRHEKTKETAGASLITLSQIIVQK